KVSTLQTKNWACGERRELPWSILSPMVKGCFQAIPLSYLLERQVRTTPLLLLPECLRSLKPSVVSIQELPWVSWPNGGNCTKTPNWQISIKPYSLPTKD